MTGCREVLSTVPASVNAQPHRAAIIVYLSISWTRLRVGRDCVFFNFVPQHLAQCRALMVGAP